MLAFEDPNKAIENAFLRLTGRNPRKEELHLLVALREEEYQKFKLKTTKTEGWLNTGEFRISTEDDKALVAANAVVASTIMNLDATIMKR